MNNKERLGSVLDGRMKKTSGAAVPTSVELGTINSNLSLTTDSLQSPIPKGEYMVDIRLSGGTYDTSSTTHTHGGGDHVHSGGDHSHSDSSHSHSGGDHTHSGGDHTHGGGDHTHRLPEEFRLLKAGDRVLVAWCGNEPIVIAIVVSS